MRAFFLQLLILFISFTNSFGEEDASIFVIDVGEGQSVLLKKEGKGFLIDSGNFDQVYRVLEFLEKERVEELTSIYLTHLHPDHASGIFTLAHHFPAVVIYEGGKRVQFPTEGDGYRWVAEALDQNRFPRKLVSQGDVYFENGFKINILWPSQDYHGNLNESSLVLEVTYNGFVMVIMGDVTRTVEQHLLEKKLIPKQIDLLVVGHHGASDATGDEFLDYIEVEQCVISINSNNLRGYPDSKVVQKLRKKCKLHITAMEGDYTYKLQ